MKVFGDGEPGAARMDAVFMWFVPVPLWSYFLRFPLWLLLPLLVLRLPFLLLAFWVPVSFCLWRFLGLPFRPWTRGGVCAAIDLVPCYF